MEAVSKHFKRCATYMGRGKAWHKNILVAFGRDTSGEYHIYHQHMQQPPIRSGQTKRREQLQQPTGGEQQTTQHQGRSKSGGGGKPVSGCHREAKTSWNSVKVTCVLVQLPESMTAKRMLGMPCSKNAAICISAYYTKGFFVWTIYEWIYGHWISPSNSLHKTELAGDREGVCISCNVLSGFWEEAYKQFFDDAHCLPVLHPQLDMHVPPTLGWIQSYG